MQSTRNRILASTICAAAVVSGPCLALADIEQPTDDPGLNEQSIPAAAAARMAAMARGQGGGSDLPKFDDIAKDFEQVISTTDDKRPLYNMWVRKRDAQILIELPGTFESQDLFIAYTITGGIPTAGVQFGDMYAKWKRFDKRLALIEPNFQVRTSGDAESRHGKERVFTDRIILDMPIAAQGPNGGVVINATDWLLGNATTFFGRSGAFRRHLAQIATAKTFPQNIEVGFELPAVDGRIVNIHYSISALPSPGSTGYKPREADNRVGFFTTTYRDIGDASKDTPWVRYVNRWHLEKADPSLKLSPPKQPIVFYVEHTTPIRYRRWVREGILEWNKAFEKIGIIDAVEVRQQDSRTGAYMDIDPADARYNFVLWTNAGMGFAIGPSRVDPRTGQILDADVVLDEGFITSWANAWRQLIPEIAMEGFGPDTYAWLETRPEWDPRVRLAPPAERDSVIKAIQAQRATRGIHRFSAHPAMNSNPQLMGQTPYDGLAGRVSQVNGMCMSALAKSLDIAMMRLGPELIEEITNLRFEKVTADDDPVGGTWTGAVNVPEMGGEIDVTLTLTRHEDNSVTGTVDAYAGSITVAGNYDADDRSLLLYGEVPEMGRVEFDLKIAGESMSGTVMFSGRRLPIAFDRTARPVSTSYMPIVEASARDLELLAQADKAKQDDDEDDESEDDSPKPKTEPRDSLDGMPEWFVGPLLRDLVMHEVGHTLGLRHNFRASGIYSTEQVNSPEHKGKAITGSVMDYNPININFGDGPVQGEYSMVTIGPYDYWAIEYGYTFDNHKNVLKRVGDPELAYATDEDTWGPDPLARRFDFGSNPLEYSESQMRLVQHLRGQLLDRVVKDGDSWSKARRGYEILLSRQLGAVSIAANWIGGSSINRDQKGDPAGRAPIESISSEQQRRALNFVIENTFRDDAFGLTDDLLSHMTIDKWWDSGGFNSIYEDNTWPVHDRIMSIQASALTMILNPTSLRRVFDNEFRANGEGALTLPEVLDGITDAAWSEIDRPAARQYTAANPMISSLRRNLQSEVLKRLIDLSMPNSSMGIASKPIANLSVFKLRDLKGKIDRTLERHGSRLDAYTMAHLDEARVRIEKALDAQYIYNADAIGGGGLPSFLFLHENQPESSHN